MLLGDVAICLASSVTCILYDLVVLGFAGVPDICPVIGFIVSPLGKLDAAPVVGSTVEYV